MRVISEEEVRRHVSFEAVLFAIERAFMTLDAGESEIFDVVRARGGGDQHAFGIKSARDASIPLLGLKAGSYAPENHARGLPAHSSTTLLLDDCTGQPIALVQANYLNGLRTSAADALAVRELAAGHASTLGIIGIGGQAVFEALAVSHVRPIRRILAVGASPTRRAAFERQVRDQRDVSIDFVDAEVAVREADVIVTVTPSRSPVVRADWVRAGTHISAMGADSSGKQELEVELLAKGALWVDHPEQAARIGEAQHAVLRGLCTVESMRERTLGGLLRGRLARPKDESAITIFDSSGVAVQDIAAAYAALSCVDAVASRSQ